MKNIEGKKMSNHKYVNMIELFLKRKYEEKGNNNFYFKSKHIAKEIPLHTTLIGKTLKIMLETNKVTRWTDEGCICTVWKTNFK